MPLPLTVSCFSKIQIGFAFLVPAHLGSPGKMAVKRVCVCVYGGFRSQVYTLQFNRHCQTAETLPVLTSDSPTQLYEQLSFKNRKNH